MSFFNKVIVEPVQVTCVACDGTGKQQPVVGGKVRSYSRDDLRMLMFLNQGICLGCNGAGIQLLIPRKSK